MSIVAVALLTAALLACVWMQVAVRVNRQHFNALQREVDAVRIAERARVQLLVFSQQSDLVDIAREDREAQRTDATYNLFARLDELRGQVDPSVMPQLEEAVANVRAYMTDRRKAASSGRSPEALLRALNPSLEGASGSLDQVARKEEALERAHSAHIGRWDTYGLWVSAVVAAVDVLGTAAVIWVTYQVIFLPLLALAGSMKRFAAGHQETRAQLPAGNELAAAAAAFNDMADLIVQGRTRMLEFLRTVAQELRDPARMIKISLEECSPGKPPLATEKLQARLAVVCQQANRLEKLAESFFDATRIEWEGLNLRQQRRDLRGVIEEVVETYQSATTAHQIEISAPAEPVVTHLDWGRMSQVLHTLIANAIELSPQGGVIPVVLEVERDEQLEAVIHVSEHGVWIPPESVEQLFEPFHQFIGSRFDGPGLAVPLWIARRTVEAHGGRLDIESKEGEGTTFCVRLPLVRGLDLAAAPHETGDGRAGDEHHRLVDAQHARETAGQPPAS
jgi:signal transduction histidine kinase